MTAKLLVASRALYSGASRAVKKLMLTALIMTALAACFATSVVILIFRIAT